MKRRKLWRNFYQKPYSPKKITGEDQDAYLKKHNKIKLTKYQNQLLEALITLAEIVEAFRKQKNENRWNNWQKCTWENFVFEKSNLYATKVKGGEFTKEIQINQGTRQGCPLSPLLFILRMEVLNEQIRNDKDIKGLKITEEFKL